MRDVGDVFYYDLGKTLALRAFKTVSINQIQLRVYGCCNAVCRSQDRSNQSDRRCIYHSLGTGGGKLYAKTLHRFSSTEREVLGLSLYALSMQLIWRCLTRPDHCLSKEVVYASDRETSLQVETSHGKRCMSVTRLAVSERGSGLGSELLHSDLPEQHWNLLRIGSASTICWH